MIPDSFHKYIATKDEKIIWMFRLLAGLNTHLASMGAFVIMIVANLRNKISILTGWNNQDFNVRDFDYYGFWAFAHESRNDLSMPAGSFFLRIKEAGALSLDLKLSRQNV